MTSRYKGRLRKLEKPGKQLPQIPVIYTDEETELEDALAYLGITYNPDDTVVCLGLLAPGEKPRFATDPSARLATESDGGSSSFFDDDDPDGNANVSN